MFRLTTAAIILFFVAGTSSAIKWVTLQEGDPLPNNTVKFLHAKSYVGRARHFNDVLPAEVFHHNSSAIIRVCGRTITKHVYEVLTTTTPYLWHLLRRGENLPEGLVLAGHENARKPLFIASRPAHYNQGGFMYTSLSATDVNNLINNGYHVLVSTPKSLWLDVSAKNVPTNAVLVGNTTKGEDVFVARLKHQCQIYPGQVIPKENSATAMINGKKIAALYSQVLVGDADQYSWVSVTDEKFPDNAVVGSTDTASLYYIARDMHANSSTYITNLFVESTKGYQILVENEKRPKPVAWGT